MKPSLRVHCFSVSADGYGAGPHQGPDDPLGVRGLELHEWMFATRTFGGAAEDHQIDGGGTNGIDDGFVARGSEGIGATIVGRNMFGPVRGDWADETWMGWWGPEPPFHHHVFVLTHAPRASIRMEGGTTFHFVTEGMDTALRRAFEAAEGQDVRLGGGVATFRQFMQAGWIDYAHLAVVPILLGRGEQLFEGLEAALTAFECRLTPSSTVLHMELTKRRDQAPVAAPPTT